MGTILTAYGDDASDHQGYAAQVLDDGSLTGTYSNDTTPRMIGQVVAACDCGWTGTTRYPSPEPFDAEELALDEWERDHARPTLEGLHAVRWDRLATLLRQLAESPSALTHTRLSDLTLTAQRDLLGRTLAALTRATELAHQLRLPLRPRER
ncbi:MAG: hypothetical protein ACRDXB_10520 [Actinomycetes bacterium]